MLAIHVVAKQGHRCFAGQKTESEDRDYKVACCLTCMESLMAGINIGKAAATFARRDLGLSLQQFVTPSHEEAAMSDTP